MREENAYVHTVIQGGQGRAQGRCRLQGLGTGDLGGKEGSTEEGGPLALGTGNGDPPGPRQKMWIGNGSSWPSGPLALQVLRPSGPLCSPSSPALRGPDAPIEHTIPPGPV